MNKRIEKLTERTMRGEMFVSPVETEFDKMDLFLPEQEKDVKRICEYILNQKPMLTEYSALSGYFRFNGSVIGEVFQRTGHKHTTATLAEFYCQRIDNLSAMDWQHGTSDYRNVLAVGIPGIIAQIDASLEKHTEPEKIGFLKGLRKIAEAFSQWFEKCAGLTAEFTEDVEDPEYKGNLERLAKALTKLAKNPPETFYEAVLTVYVCFSMNPDSFGTLDRYLYPFYIRDMAKGSLTYEEAKVYLQELFLMVQAATPFESRWFTRGGQSHFCVGGRDVTGKDCYNELSQLIIDAMMELPTHIPEVTLRWTKDTPKSVLRHVLECERKDPNKRIAFTNDDKRIEAYMKNCGFPYEEAVNYTLVGCNEPAMLGGMCASTSHGNMAHPVGAIFHERAEEVRQAETFDDFYDIFKDQLYKDLDRIYYYDDWYNLQRGKDINYVSCLFLNGPIEKGMSITQGGVNYAVSAIMFVGNVTVIDSLAIIKQFVYDEKIVTMEEMLAALHANWEGYEDLRGLILKKGDFFGNDEEISNEVAKRFYDDLYEYVRNKRTVYGYPVLMGDHTGYPLHFKWFGEGLKATPDGRYAGEPVSYGIFQTGGKDRNGLTALMNAISKFDEHGISSSTVTNFNLDDSYAKNEESFEKTVDMLESYFKNGGMQFQLNYVSKEELLKAKAEPEKYKNLRVRVTGYSDYFIRLDEVIQDSVIKRYER